VRLSIVVDWLRLFSSSALIALVRFVFAVVLYRLRKIKIKIQVYAVKTRS